MGQKKVRILLALILVLSMLQNATAQSFSKSVTVFARSSRTSAELSSKELIKIRSNEFKSTLLLELKSNANLISVAKIIDFEVESVFHNFIITKKSINPDNSYTLIGKENDNEMYLTAAGNNISVNLSIGEKRYTIIPLENGLHLLAEVSLSVYKNEEESVSINVLSGETNLFPENKNTAAKTDVDILVAYTPAAEANASNLNAIIANSIAEANQSFVNSGINLEYHLVHTKRINYTEGSKDNSTVLNDFSNNAEIKEIRNEYRADLCFLVTNGTNISGCAYWHPDPSASTSHTGYGIGNYNRIRDTRTLAHETGHNFGCMHNIEIASSSGYNHGYLCEPGNFCTIMAYYTTSSRMRKNYWSDPTNTYNSRPLGIADESDNVRWIKNQKTDIEDYRKFQVCNTISSNHRWRRNIKLTGDVLIASGACLTIESGSSVDLNGRFIKSTGGSIIIESGANVNYKGLVKNISGTVRGLYSTIQSGIDNAGTNQTLEVVAGNFNESLAITGKSRVKINGKGKGITIINSPVEFTNSEYCNLTNMTIKNDQAITINGGNRPNVSFVEFSECYDMANIYDVTSFLFSGNKSKDFNSPEFGVDAYRSTGDITGCEIEDFDLFLYSTDNSYVTATQNYFCHNGMDLYASNGGYISTQNCTYSKTPPQSFLGNVGYGGGGTYCSATVQPPIQVTSLEKTTDDVTDLKEVNRVMAEIMSSVSRRYELAGAKGEDARVNELKGVIGVYRDILREKNDNAHVKAILGKLSHCYRFIGNNTEFDNLVGSMLKEKKYSPSKPEIKRYLIGKAIRENDYSLGLKLADEILEEKNIDNGLAAEMLYEKGLIYKHYMKDIASAKEVYKRLAENHPESRLAGFVKYDLKEEGKSFGKENGEEKKEEAGEKFTVGNYPNPFNPVTRISYSLPERGMVSVKVYDMLGQEVATLVNEIKESGQYQVTFDASKFSSGLYIYTVTSGKYSATKKMLLIK